MLLAEYSEAGQACRAHEGYVRTTLNMYLTLSVAVAGFLVSVSIAPAMKAYVCAVTAVISMCMVLLVMRHRKIYSVLAQRARDIETELGMALYTQAKVKLTGDDEPTAKTLSAFIIGLIGVAYLIAAVLIACRA